MKIPEDRKKHGFDLDGYPICEGDKVKFMGDGMYLRSDDWLGVRGKSFIVHNIEAPPYEGKLGVFILGENLKGDRIAGWTNTWNLLKIAD